MLLPLSRWNDNCFFTITAMDIPMDEYRYKYDVEKLQSINRDIMLWKNRNECLIHLPDHE